MSKVFYLLKLARTLIAAGLLASAVLGPGLAAALLVLAVFLWPGDDRGAGAYWMPSNPGLSVSRSSRAMPPELAAAIQAYDRKDAAGAVRLLQDLDTEDAFEDVRRLYLAGALLNQGQAADALAVLPDPRSLPSFRRGHAQWIRYLALEAAGESEEARVLLDQLGRRVDAVGDSARARLGAR